MKLLCFSIMFLLLFSFVCAQITSAADTSFYIENGVEGSADASLDVAQESNDAYFSDILIIFLLLIVIFAIYFLMKRRE